jgi:hypothetical protein
MPRIMKPPTDGFNNTDTGTGFYDGPPPPPGVYKGTIKQLALAKIATGENQGTDRLHLVVEISDGKYKGAGLVHSLNLTKQGEPFVNQFLRSLTDGSEEQWVGIREAFWHTGYQVADKPDAKKRLAILKIGKKTNPIGMATSFVTRMRTVEKGEFAGQERVDIARFVTPHAGNGNDAEDTADDGLDDMESAGEDAYETSALDEFTEEKSQNKVVVDLDDPWS